MQMQMMFQNSNQNQDPAQAQNLAMMAGFMPMQQPQFNNMGQLQVVNIRSNQTGQDGSTQSIEKQLNINQLDQSYEVNNQIKQAVDAINRGQNEEGMNILIRLSNEKKIFYQINNMENAEQNNQNTVGK